MKTWSHLRFEYTKEQYFILVHYMVQQPTVLTRMREASEFQDTKSGLEENSAAQRCAHQNKTLRSVELTHDTCQRLVC